MNKTIFAAILSVIFALASPLSAQDETINEVSISATIRTYVLIAPRPNAELVGILQAGAEMNAYGRDADGNWLRIMEGWVLGEVFNTEGEVGALPDATHSFLAAAKSNASLYDGPSERWFEVAGTVDKSEQVLVIGRNEDSSWLQTPFGWLESGNLEISGDVSMLPVKPSGVIITAKTRTFILKEPDLSAEFVDVFEAGEEALAIGQAGEWLQIDRGWVSEDAVDISGNQQSLKFSGDGIPIVVKFYRATIRQEPRIKSESVRQMSRDERSSAIGRSSDGSWLQTDRGWGMVSSFDILGNYMDLPVTWSPSESGELRRPESADDIAIVARYSARIREVPSISGKSVGRTQAGRKLTATGRDETGNWLQLAQGWVSSVSLNVKGNYMLLPITWPPSESSASRTTRRTTNARATPTPTRTLDARTIRSLIARHTDDIRILDLETASSATTIEYDLKPWPFVPNESIADEVAFKIICAIRNGQPIPNTLKFIGHTHFKSEVGRKFTGPSVEMHISAGNANRIVCRGNDPSDINWRRLASRYKSYPIPRGASIDYD